MKILFVTPFYRPSYIHGGPTRSIPSLCEGLSSKGHSVTVYTTNTNGVEKLDVDVGSRYNKSGVSVFYFDHTKIRGKFFFSNSLKNKLYKNVSQFDIVYVYGIWNYPAIAAGSACRKQDTPYIVSPRTGLMRWPMQQSWFAKQVYLQLFGWRYLRGAWAMHYTTDIEREESEQHGVGTPGIVVPNCIDFSEFDSLPERGRFRSRLGVDSDSPLVLFLGRIDPRKGLELSLRAFARVQSSLPDVHFAIAGPGDDEYVNELRRLSANLDVQYSTTFTGYVGADERLRALVDAEVFILTSHTENFAMAAVEAMAAETPVLLSNEVGVAPAADQADAGISVPLDEDEITEALHQLLSDASVRERMAANGPNHVRSQYSPESVADQMVNEIQTLMRLHKE